MKSPIALLAALCVMTSVALSPARAAAVRPNIVYILADDLGYGDVGVYNPQSKIPTPHLDRLAAEGMRFTDAHAPDAVCTPTRYGLLTGRYAFRSQLKSGVLPPWGAPLIEEGRLTVPDLLRQSGYATACIGKWHLGWSWPTKDGQPPASKDGVGNVDFAKPIPGGPTARGFDRFFGVDVPNYPPYCFIEDNRTVGIPAHAAPQSKGGFNRPGPVVEGWNLTNIMPDLTTHAVRYIESAAAQTPAKPFFLYFPITAPHYPVVPTPEFQGRSQAGAYGDFVAQVDHTVGEVMAALGRTGLATNTLIIFTSDNGPEVGEVEIGTYERIQRYGHRSAGDWRGAKRDAWEGGHRVPFIARWPNHIPAAAVSDETICHVDLLATCAAMVGEPLPPDAGEDSYNILPALLGQKLAKPIREATILHSARGSLAIRQGDWVLIDRRPGDLGREPGWVKQEQGYQADSFPGALYNLRADRAQKHNLYGAKPAIVQDLKTLLAKYQTEGRSTPAAAAAKLESPADRAERMKWWREARFGMFVHWGLYSGLAGNWNGKVVGTKGGMEWLQNRVGADTFTYASNALPLFQPKPNFATEWARVAKEAGCRYVVFTTKHHDGFSLHDSQAGDFDAGSRLNRDLVKEIVTALRAEGLRVGFYHSVIDWHHDQYGDTLAKGLPYPGGNRAAMPGARKHAKYVRYLHQQVDELMSNYGTVDIVWWDYSSKEFQGDVAWRASALLANVRAKQPNIIMNNRLFRTPEAGWLGNGMTTLPKLETRYGDFITPEQHIPENGMPDIDWETCMTMNTTWGFNAHDRAWKSDETFIRNLVDIASKGGNYLLNIGPTGDGSVPPESVQALRAIGAWMKMNGESIYGTTANPFTKLAWGTCTKKITDTGGTLYLHLLHPPTDGKLVVPGFTNSVRGVRLLGGGQLTATANGHATVVHLPAPAPLATNSVIALEFSGRLAIKSP